jgi:hypothetical protein
MTSLLNNLLDLKKIESGYVRVRRTKTDALSLLEQCHMDFLPPCRAKRQQLRVELPSYLPPILADTNQIHQVLVNLLSNAHKFTPIEGTITLRAQADASHIRIEVQDTGMGIRAEEFDAIFEAFRQVEREDGPGSQGTGLGLTISKNIIELHDGEIGVESVYNRGSLFYITLPVWGEDAELVAYITDRLREAQARKVPCSLLLLRGAQKKASGPPDSVIKAMNRVLSASDSGMWFPTHGWFAYVLETNAQGLTAALEQLAGELLNDDAVSEFAIWKMATAHDATEWISRGPQRWSAFRDLSPS